MSIPRQMASLRGSTGKHCSKGEYMKKTKTPTPEETTTVTTQRRWDNPLVGPLHGLCMDQLRNDGR